MSSHVLSRAPRSPAASGGGDISPGVIGGVAALSSLQAQLLDLVPAARRILVCGATSPAFADGYAQRHPGTELLRDGTTRQTVQEAAVACGLVVFPDGLADIAEPKTLLEDLAAHCAPGVALYIGFASPSELAPPAPTAPGQPRLRDDHAAQSRRGNRAALAKLLMDAGWMPDLVGHTVEPGTQNRVNGILLQATRCFDAAEPGTNVGRTGPGSGARPGAKSLSGGHEAQGRAKAGVNDKDKDKDKDQGRTQTNDHIDTHVHAQEQEQAGAPSPFAVVVPTNRQAELELNVQSSPGLAEANAPVYAIREATSPADALATALPHITQDWVLLCHQDVYFPVGFGHRLGALLAAIPAEDHDRTLIGFVGKSVDGGQGDYADAGFMIDRLERLDRPASTTAVSLDEAAVVLSRRSLHRIDPEMGWHLWATDLCLTAIHRHSTFARIVRLPLFHNSSNDRGLPDSFLASSGRLLKKFPDFGPIPTLCGTIQPAARSAPTPVCSGAAPRHPDDSAASTPADPPAVPSPDADAPARQHAGCCICGRAVQHWLPHPNIAARSEFTKLLDAVGSELSVYECPACHSTDRDRHLWHYMNALGLPERMASMRVLHIAPERHIEALLLGVGPRTYVRGDLHPQRPEHRRLDVEALEFADASFDLILCNHVLEHVATPARALGELHRCLGAGGLLIAQTPYAPTLRNTFELVNPVSGAFARLFYGQDDHLRLFGADVVDRFHAAGFQGDLLPHRVVLPGIDALAHGCNPREPFFCFSK